MTHIYKKHKILKYMEGEAGAAILIERAVILAQCPRISR